MTNRITIRILDGADRGRIYRDLPPPVTVGREEGNTIRLNDERISRFHLKIQEDQDELVLVDMDSTNGTRVNGEDVRLRILRHGDMIAIGRSMLLFGSREEIAARLAALRGEDLPILSNADDDEDRDEEELEYQATDESLPILDRPRSSPLLDFELNWFDDEENELQATLHALEPPELPKHLSPGQAAQLAELLEYMQIRLRRLLSTAKRSGEEAEEQIILDERRWQDLLDLQARLGGYLRQIGEPEEL